MDEVTKFREDDHLSSELLPSMSSTSIDYHRLLQMDNNRYHECNLILALLFIIDVVLLMLQHLLVMLMALWLHRREEQHFLDIAAVGDEHCKAIDTKAPSAGWRHAMLKCFA